MNNTFSYEAFLSSLNTAQARYLATSPTDNAGNALTSSADIHKGSKFVDAACIVAIGALMQKGNVDSGAMLTAIETRLSMKAIMRLCEFFAAIHAKNYQRLDGVTCLSILSATLAGATSRDALIFATTGKGDESTSDLVKNTALVRKLQNVLNKVGVTTAPTQLSRSFGINGFCSVIGIGRIVKSPDGTRELIEINQRNPFYRAVFTMIDTATEGTLKLMRGAKKDSD